MKSSTTHCPSIFPYNFSKGNPFLVSWGCRIKKKCGSLFLISKYPTTQKPDSKEPGFCCKIQLCH
jgi:hypothetical protein